MSLSQKFVLVPNIFDWWSISIRVGVPYTSMKPLPIKYVALLWPHSSKFGQMYTPSQMYLEDLEPQMISYLFLVAQPNIGLNDICHNVQWNHHQAGTTRLDCEKQITPVIGICYHAVLPSLHNSCRDHFIHLPGNGNTIILFSIGIMGRRRRRWQFISCNNSTSSLGDAFDGSLVARALENPAILFWWSSLMIIEVHDLCWLWYMLVSSWRT